MSVTWLQSLQYLSWPTGARCPYVEDILFKGRLIKRQVHFKKKKRIII